MIGRENFRKNHVRPPHREVRQILAACTVVVLLLTGLAWDGLTETIESMTGISLARVEVLSALAMVATLGLSLYLLIRLGRLLPYGSFTRAERQIIRALPKAIEAGQIQPHFQPVVDSATGRMVAVEALARWQRPDGAVLSPGAFIPLAERAGLIRAVTKCIAEQAVRTAALWRSQQISMPISINLAVEDLEADDLVDHLIALCDRYDLPYSQIRVELTETQSVDHSGAVRRAVATLRAAGIAVFLDDFGTGYASLSLLHNIPFTGLKLDQSFVRSLTQDSRADTIVRATVEIAQELGLAMIAEGVEDLETLHHLRRLGIQHVQGYLYARPIVAQAVVDLCQQDPWPPVLI